MIDFRFHIENDTYVVWLAGINRYMQLKEPAFRVFEQWAAGNSKNVIAKACTMKYALPEAESTRFVGEITNLVQSLFSDSLPGSPFQAGDHDIPLNPEYFSAHTYQIGTHSFRFCYRNQYLKDLFHPLFQHHETDAVSAPGSSFELFNEGVMDGFRVNNSDERFFPVEDIDGYQGAVFMEMLNAIHGMKNDEWMGVIHASAVTDGSNTVIFTAPSGSGKTSIALLMMVNGFSIMSDDFVPVALHEPEIYHFPSGISVKKGAIPFMKAYLPQLITENYPETEVTEVYLPPAGVSGVLSNSHAKAIVFVKYDPAVDYKLTKESNLEVMNQLIRQSWIAGTHRAAEKFLEWYFKLPVYSLRYSNNSKAVEGLRKLFE